MQHVDYTHATTDHRRWMLALRGLLAIIFGLVTITFPHIALLAFVAVFAVYAIIEGLVALAAVVRERKSLPRWGWLLVEGILSIAAGVLAVVYPHLTALILLYIIAAWAILTGITELLAAARERRHYGREWILVLASLASIAFGVILFLFPGVGLLSLLWVVGIYAIVFGVLYLIRAFQRHEHAHPAEQVPI